MSTGYRLEIGYNSAGTRDDFWPAMKTYALKLCEAPDLIAAEVRRIQPTISAEDAIEYAESYRDRVDLTVTFHEQPNHFEKPDEFQPYIYQIASGGGVGREIKEACRRAFCRLVIEAMHMRRIEVNLRVS